MTLEDDRIEEVGTELAKAIKVGLDVGAETLRAERDEAIRQVEQARQEIIHLNESCNALGEKLEQVISDQAIRDAEYTEAIRERDEAKKALQLICVDCPDESEASRERDAAREALREAYTRLDKLERETYGNLALTDGYCKALEIIREEAAKAGEELGEN
jgi:hypothetical protein